MRRFEPPLGPPRLPPTHKGEPWRDARGRYTWSPGASLGEIERAKAKANQAGVFPRTAAGDDGPGRPRRPRVERPEIRRPARPTVSRVDPDAEQATVRETLDRVVIPAGVETGSWRTRYGMTGPYVEVSRLGSDRRMAVHLDGSGWVWDETVDEPDPYGVEQTVRSGGGRADDDATMVAVIRDFVLPAAARAAVTGGQDRYVRADDVLSLLRAWGYLPQQRAAVDPDAARSLLEAFDPFSDMDDTELTVFAALDEFERSISSPFDRGYSPPWERKRLPTLVGQALAEFNAKHARYPKGHPQAGKFRPMMSRLIESLHEWRRMKGQPGRGDDPFAGVASTAALRRVLKARGAQVPPKVKDVDEDRKAVVKALLTEFRGREGRWRLPKGVDRKSWDSVLRLAAGEKVTVSPEEVPGIVRAIGKIRWKRRKGQPDITFNFSNLQVTGEGNENAFQRHLRDRPRSTMPQLPTGTGPGDATSSGKTMAEWEAYLESQGVKFEYGQMDPRELVATQSEMSGPKVSKMFGFMDSGWKDGGVMIVARSGGEYVVVDGHHRWAGAVLQSIARGGTFEVTTMVIDADIDDLLGTQDKPDGIAMGFADFEGLSTDRER